MRTGTNWRQISARPLTAVAAGALAAGLFAAQPAAAQSATPSGCAAMVEQFAADQGLSMQPPPTAVPGTAMPGMSGSTPRDETGSGGSGASSDRLAQSGGTVAPPSVGDRAVIEPPATGSNMPTAPSMAPQTSQGSAQGSAPGSSSGLSSGSRADAAPAPGGAGSTGDLMGRAARNAQLESLVTAARAAAREGDETRCMDSLSDAKRLSRTAPGGSGG
ncbi:hypothetical protein [Azospirillum picis]|uniref:Uncharacterized protein n=1 Tax=Azospirillum picis TaxID=488438 RepID=A0ABU0MKX8_9PROT|nr:hypothetical protein [Azospirillum picis]MBP2300264.1 hypothetical protein [Azospirillum picis]MDQ0533894.1 hypothetical protein [Azospirillum picis]